MFYWITSNNFESKSRLCLCKNDAAVKLNLTILEATYHLSESVSLFSNSKYRYVNI